MALGSFISLGSLPTLLLFPGWGSGGHPLLMTAHFRASVGEKEDNARAIQQIWGAGARWYLLNQDSGLIGKFIWWQPKHSAKGNCGMGGGWPGKALVALTLSKVCQPSCFFVTQILLYMHWRNGLL